MQLSDLDKNQRSLLCYAETACVDQGGLLEGVRMNVHDHVALDLFKAARLLDFGRIPGRVLIDRPGGVPGKSYTHWVRLSPEGWTLAWECRLLRSKQLGPYAQAVFNYVGSGDDAAVGGG